MKVSNVHINAISSYTKLRVHDTQQVGGTSGCDRIELSKDAQLFTNAMREIKDMFEQDSVAAKEKMAQLEQQVHSGEYRADTMQTAEKMLQP